MMSGLVFAALSAFGLNYYAPFSVDYSALCSQGADVRQVIRDDIQHFRRLGLDGIRLHCFDRQISDADGHLIENNHTQLLDFLIAECASNGIRTVLTPIAWWGGPFAPEKDGFSNRYAMEQMVSDPIAIAAQRTYLGEFVRRYGQSSAVMAFELINEPLYPEMFPDDRVVDYVNSLVDAVRATGCEKPLFYNTWKGRDAVASTAHVEGASGSCYPTRLNAASELKGDLLSTIKATSLCPARLPPDRLRMIYEFDAPCTSASYLYPAMARLFRHEGVDLAFQFQYDPLPVADDNRNWKNHYLNLVYTPSKALSLAIAAEAFRRLPAGCPFVRSRCRMTFAPFLVDAERDLSQMLTEEDFLYSNDTDDAPTDTSKLLRVWGVGRSKVVATDGAGAYFLDKLSEGLWRFQLYPDVFKLADPYTFRTNGLVLAHARTLRVRIGLPDLGQGWRVRRAGDFQVVVTAAGGEALIPPGDYIVENVREFGSRDVQIVQARPMPRYVIPALSTEPAGRLIARRRQEADTRRSAVPVADTVGRLDVSRCFNVPLLGAAFAMREECRDEFGARAVRVKVSTDKSIRCGYAGIRVPFAGPRGNGCERITVTVKGAYDGERIEVVFVQDDETAWGTQVTLSREWQTYSLDVASLQPRWDTLEMPWHEDRARASRFVALSVGFGKWLFEKSELARDHAFELSDVRCESAAGPVNFRGDYDVRDFGARPDGQSVNTKQLQRAIDVCSKAGGGRVVVSGGTFVTGTLVLKSGVELHLAAGGCLKGSSDWQDWKDQPQARHVNPYMCARHRTAALVFADEAENIALTGRGVLDGNGFAFVERDMESGSGQLRRKLGLEFSPPRLVFFAGCRRVRVEGIRVLYPPAGWSFWVHDCDDVVFTSMEIFSDVDFPNNDGIHINCSRDVRVSDCLIETGDDAIIIRANSASLAEDKPCERVTVNNCVLRSYSSGIRIGWLNDGVIRNCAFSNLVIHDSVCGVGLLLPAWSSREQAADQGREATMVENISFSNIMMDRIVARPLYVHIDPGSNTQVKAVRNLRFAGVMASGQMYPIFSAPRPGVVSDIRLENCVFQKDPPGAPGYPARTEIGFSKCQRFLSDREDDNVERITYQNVVFR